MPRICLRTYSIFYPFLDDDGIPPFNFYGNRLKTLAKKVTLSDAQAAVSALPDSDVEDEMQNEGDRSQEDETDEDVGEDSEIEQGTGNDGPENEQTDEEDNIPLQTLAENLRQNNNKKGKNQKNKVTWDNNEYFPPDIVFSPSDNNETEASHKEQTPLTYFLQYFPKEVFAELAEKSNMYSIQKRERTSVLINQKLGGLLPCIFLWGLFDFLG